MQIIPTSTGIADFHTFSPPAQPARKRLQARDTTRPRRRRDALRMVPVRQGSTGTTVSSRRQPANTPTYTLQSITSLPSHTHAHAFLSSGSTARPRTRKKHTPPADTTPSSGCLFTENSPAKRCGPASTSSPPSRPRRTATRSAGTWPTSSASGTSWAARTSGSTTARGSSSLPLPSRPRSQSSSGSGRSGQDRQTGFSVGWWCGACVCGVCRGREGGKMDGGRTGWQIRLAGAASRASSSCAFNGSMARMDGSSLPCLIECLLMPVGGQDGLLDVHMAWLAR